MLMLGSATTKPGTDLGREALGSWLEPVYTPSSRSRREVGKDDTDEALLTAHIAGDAHAFRQLFSRYARRMFVVITRHGLSEADAQDVVQRTFLQVHQARRDFKPQLSFRPWLWTIAYNLMRSTHRGDTRARARELRLAPAAAPEELAPLPYEEQQSVRLAIASLSLQQQEVVVLHWYEGLSFPEIARVVRASESAVKVRAHRAYQQLRELLDEPARTGG